MRRFSSLTGSAAMRIDPERLQASLAEMIPGKPFSRDNFASLGVDSVGTRNGFAELGIVPRRFAAMLPMLLGDNSRAYLFDVARATQEQ